MTPFEMRELSANWDVVRTQYSVNQGTTTQIAQADPQRYALIVAGPTTQATVDIVNPVVAQVGLQVLSTTGNLDLHFWDHGGLCQRAFYATGNQGSVTLVVIEVFFRRG